MSDPLPIWFVVIAGLIGTILGWLLIVNMLGQLSTHLSTRSGVKSGTLANAGEQTGRYGSGQKP